MPIRNPAIPARTAPTRILTKSLAGFDAPPIAELTMTAVNAPTDIKPACPSESSPEIPTTRLSETAMII